MAISHRTAEFERWLGQEREAKAIGNLWAKWKNAINKDMDLKKEARDYVFATSTRTTSNAKLPWRNSTTIPKLCQIRDNLHANYMAALFPNDDWLEWDGDDADAASIDKRRKLEAYTQTKLRDMEFRTVVSRLVYDYIDYGNSFAGVDWVVERGEDGVVVYAGPKVYRISPEDVVFDITAASFENTPVITRSLKSMGDFEKDLLVNETLNYDKAKIEELRAKRKAIAERGASDDAFKRWKGLSIDGFGTIQDYFSSGYIEILEFVGDWYDPDTQTLHTNQLITIADRCIVLRNIKNETWGGRKLVCHVGWRLRPDNLLAMGPLDNLVGMQYRIDHLENLKADAADMTLFPVFKTKGWVEDFNWQPGERIDCGDDGDVSPVTPSVDLVRADNMIADYMALMEEMAGAPKEAMGFRTPGEKTAYEVQRLENAAGRVFQDKISYFEQVFIERLVNLCVLVARQNMGPGVTKVKALDSSYGALEFVDVTKEDLMSRGKFRAVGARHFAEKATLLQNLNTFMSSNLGQDAGIRVHISNKKMAHLVEGFLGMRRFALVQEFSGLAEAAELEQMKQQLMPQQPPAQPEQAPPMSQEEQIAAQLSEQLNK